MQKLESHPEDFSDFVLPMDNLEKLKATNAYKKAFYASDAFFSSELVSLDTLIDGAYEALRKIDWLSDFNEDEPYEIVFLTSRPETMRDATIAWLNKHSLYYNTVNGHRELVMKAPAFQYVKTVTWKAGMVQTLATLYGAEIVKFVDDEEANWNALLQHTPYILYSLEWCKSLQDAIEGLS